MEQDTMEQGIDQDTMDHQGMEQGQQDTMEEQDPMEEDITTLSDKRIGIGTCFTAFKKGFTVWKTNRRIGWHRVGDLFRIAGECYRCSALEVETFAYPSFSAIKQRMDSFIFFPIGIVFFSTHKSLFRFFVSAVCKCFGAFLLRY